MGLTNSFAVSSVNQELICQSLGSKIVASGECQGDFWIHVHGDDLVQTIEFLKTHPSLQFDSFVDLCGVDYLHRHPRFEVTTHLYSQSQHHRIRIRCLVPDDTLTVPSLTPYWKGANWQEREAFDMYGIRFRGHPNLERILSPPATEVFPQRKDYPLKGEREPKEE